MVNLERKNLGYLVNFERSPIHSGYCLLLAADCYAEDRMMMAAPYGFLISPEGQP